MKALIRASLLAVALAGAAVPVAPALARIGDANVAAPMPSLAPLLRDVTPAVVNVSVVSRVRIEENPLYADPFFRRFFNLPEQQPRERQSQSVGSGVIVDAGKGYVLTNNHVIARADSINVTLKDGRMLKAKLVGTDPGTDIAVLQIPAENLTALPLGDSSKLEVGDYVVAVGNPFGLGQTVTSGIVSALGRTGLGIEGYEDFIQTDASINPGNSGGALVDLSGQLVGINTAILAPSGGNVGIGFAVPVNMARSVFEQIVEHGEVRRGRLGVAIQDVTPDIAAAVGLERAQGALIARVEDGSAAERAGLRQGDIVLAVDGTAIKGATDLRNRVGLSRAGETLELTVQRRGEQRSVKVKPTVMREPQQSSTGDDN